MVLTQAGSEVSESSLLDVSPSRVDFKKVDLERKRGLNGRDDARNHALLQPKVKPSLEFSVSVNDRQCDQEKGEEEGENEELFSAE